MKIGKLIYIGAIVILSLVFIALLLEKSQVSDFYQKPVSNVSQVDQKEVNVVDYSPADPTDNNDINSKKNSGEIDQSTSQTPPQSGEPINVVLTAATQDTPGGPVVVRVLLTDVSSGSCLIKISKLDESKEYSRNVVNAGTYYNCEGLDIPLSDISAGQWDLSVKVTSGDRTGVATQIVEVKE